LRRIAAKNSRTVENDREKFSGPLIAAQEHYGFDCIGLIATDCSQPTASAFY